MHFNVVQLCYNLLLWYNSSYQLMHFKKSKISVHLVLFLKKINVVLLNENLIPKFSC